ncbi:CDP-glucose 4,6-dehydratase [Acidocella sp.]|uniref:CDP-glucose 4,6-dehydratase n=1 Tax=Acidocella sp. TaxID=50710 RepID=UPI00260E0866|nr:CDP-glucose 4,6-dehydratase [Acidocella sp.]
MVSRLPAPEFWRGQHVLVTGHTGFKGGWLSLWLSKLGAEVAGYALAPDTVPDFFSLCGVEGVLRHQIADVRALDALRGAVASFRPRVIFHLAAQPLVRASYARPMETYETNIMGTANILCAANEGASVERVVIITSDKVYAESDEAHGESAPLGGKDPYSASKACAELVAASYPLRAGLGVASVRAGNVIGGGDWAADRLVPDFFRAMLTGERLRVRNPRAIRPWQHVLDPLCGYMLAAEDVGVERVSWNFGPDDEAAVTVGALAEKLCALWGAGAAYELAPQAEAPHEAPVLRLSSAKARAELGWAPRLGLDEALRESVEWYRAFGSGADMKAFSTAQIEAYGSHE